MIAGEPIALLKWILINMDPRFTLIRSGDGWQGEMGGGQVAAAFPFSVIRRARDGSRPG